MLERQISKLANERLRLYPAVAILGPRQVGKTTLVKEFRKSNSDQILYFDLENYSDRQAFITDRFFFLQSKADKTIILDEIQYLSEVFNDLRSLIDEDRRNGRFIILGSASPLLIQNASESLTGRISFLELTCTHLTTRKLNILYT
jgi:predicted AAA+ superfamily ATPase